MDASVIIVTIGVWFLFTFLAIFNAVIRIKVFKPKYGDLVAHQMSSITFICIIFLVTYLLFRSLNLQLSDLEALGMGTTWFILTVLFEFVAGHYAFGNPWEKLIADYNLLKGRIWILVLLAILAAPYLINKVFF